MNAIGWSAEKIARRAGRGPEGRSPVIISFAAKFVMAWVLAGFIGHPEAGRVAIRDGIISGAFVGLGLVATTMAESRYAGAKRALTVIDGDHRLAC